MQSIMHSDMDNRRSRPLRGVAGQPTGRHGVLYPLFGFRSTNIHIFTTSKQRHSSLPTLSSESIAPSTGLTSPSHLLNGCANFDLYHIHQYYHHQQQQCVHYPNPDQRYTTSENPSRYTPSRAPTATSARIRRVLTIHPTPALDDKIMVPAVVPINT